MTKNLTVPAPDERQSDGPGRPPHEPTDETRELVLTAVAARWGVGKIASSLGISQPTLRKHYFEEMASEDAARARVEGALITSLWAGVRDGKLTAVDRLQNLVRKGDPAPAKMGKKEQQNADAHEALNDPAWSQCVN